MTLAQQMPMQKGMRRVGETENGARACRQQQRRKAGWIVRACRASAARADRLKKSLSSDRGQKGEQSTNQIHRMHTT